MAEEINTGSRNVSQYKMVHNASKQINNNKSHCIGSKTIRKTSRKFNTPALTARVTQTQK